MARARADGARAATRGSGPTGSSSSSARAAWASSTWRSTRAGGRSRSRCCAPTSPTTTTPGPGWRARSDTLARVRDPRVARVLDADTRWAPGPTSSPATSPGRRWTRWSRSTGRCAATRCCGSARGLCRGAPRDPRGRRRAPRPQAGQRAAAGRRAGGHRLRHRPRGGRRAPHHDRARHGHPRLPLAGGRRGCPGHRRHRLVGLGGDAGLRRLRAAAVRPRPDGRRPRRVRRARPTSRGRPAARAAAQAALSPDPAGRPHADEVIEALERYAAGSPGDGVVPASRPAADPRRRCPDADQGDGAVQQPRSPVGREPARRAAGRGPARSAPSRAVGCPCRWTTTPGQGRPCRPCRSSPMASSPDGEVAPDAGPGQPDPRIGQAARSGTLLASHGRAGGATAVRPVVAVAVVRARLLGRPVHRPLHDVPGRPAPRRRPAAQRRARRGGREPVAPAQRSPRHVVALLLPPPSRSPDVLGGAGDGRRSPVATRTPNAAAPLAVGAFLGFSSPGGDPGGSPAAGGPQRRGGVRAAGARTVVLAGALLVAAALGTWSYARHGTPVWWPWNTPAEIWQSGLGLRR